MTIEELFGTLQQSIVGAWRKHLRTSKYSKHMALDEFYTEMPEKVDALIEAWMGVNGKKPKNFDNLLSSKNLGTLDYLKSLRKVVKDGYELMNGEPELEACLDDIVKLIDSTLYKIKELKENKTMIDLKDYINESLISEAISIPKKFNVEFTYDDLSFEKEEVDFLKKYLKTDKIYQLPELDENDRKVNQFSKLYKLLTKSKELEIFNFNNATYTAYELPKGTVAVYSTDPEFACGAFYLSSNNINESLISEAKSIPGISNHSFDDIAWEIYREGKSMDIDWPKEIRNTKSAYDVMEYFTMFGEIARKINIDEESLYTWVEEHDKELCKYLKNA